MSDLHRKRGFTTAILHSDRDAAVEHGALHKPLHLSVAYGYRDARELAAVFQGRAQGYAYGRQGNPTTAALEEKINRMEDGVATACFGTGMAAIGAIMLALLREGDHIVSSAFLFGNTNSMFATLATQGLGVAFVDATDVRAVEALASLASVGPRVILLTAAIQPSDLLKAIQFGARGVVMKESATRLLIDGIHRVMDGKYIIGADVADDLAQAVKQVGAERPRPYKLTAREMDIVSAIAEGQSNRQIAERLKISLQTVKHHLTSIFDKTGASNRLELALLAIRQGVVDSD